MYNGMFPACSDCMELLKNEVAKLPLIANHCNQAVDETSSAAVNALNVSLKRKHVHLSTLEWCTEGWTKTKLIEKVRQDQIDQFQLLETKFLGADGDFWDFYEVR